MDEKQLELLYKAVSGQFDIGDYQTFKSRMATPEDRRKFYDVVGAQGFDLGDYNAYEQRLGGVKKKEAGAPSLTAVQPPSAAPSVGGETAPTSTSTSLSQGLHPEAVLLNAKIIRDARSRIQQAKNSQGAPVGGSMVPMSTQNAGPSTLDLAEEKESVGLLKAAGYNPDEIVADFADVPYYEGFSVDEALKLKKENPQRYQRTLAAQKWQLPVYQAISEKAGDTAPDLINTLRQGQAQKNRAGVRASMRQSLGAVSEFVDDPLEQKRLRGLILQDKAFGYGIIDSEVEAEIAADPRSKYLNRYQVNYLHFLEDVDPQSAEEYTRLISVEPTTPDGKRGRDIKLRDLERQGMGLTQKAVEERLTQYTNRVKAGEELSEGEKGDYVSLYQQYQDLQQDARDQAARYPNATALDADALAQEAIGQANNPGKKFVLGVGENVGDAVNWLGDLVLSPFRSSEAKAIDDLEDLGEKKAARNLTYTTQKNTLVSPDYTHQFAPELQKQLDAIQSNATLSDGEKRDRARTLILQNPDGVSFVPNKDGGKFNVTASAWANAVSEVGSQIAAQAGLAFVTGGAGNLSKLGQARQLFMTTFASAYNDYYTEALEKGVSNPSTYATVHTTIEAATELVNNDLAAAKKLFRPGTAAADILNGVTKEQWDLMTRSGKGRFLAALGRTTKDALNQTKGETFEEVLGQITGNVADNLAFGQDTDLGEGLKETFTNTILGTLPLGFLGLGGQIRSINRSQAYALAEAGQNPDKFLAQLEKDVAAGIVDDAQAGKIKSAIEKAAAAYKKLKPEGENGQPLTDNQKAEALVSVILPKKEGEGEKRGPVITIAPKKQETTKPSTAVILPAQNKPAPVTTIAPKEVKAEAKSDTRPSVILPSANKGAQVVAVKRGEMQAQELPEEEVVTPKKTFDLDGKQTFFHASSKPRNGRLRTGTAPQFGTGVYFSTSKDKVTDEFGDYVTEAELALEKPVYTNTPEWHAVQRRAIQMADEAYAKRKGLKPEDMDEDLGYHRYDPDNLGELDEIDATHISNAAKELGYDAIIDKGSRTYENEIVVLDESKIIYPEDKPADVSPQSPSSAPMVNGAAERGEMQGDTITEAGTRSKDMLPKSDPKKDIDAAFDDLSFPKDFTPRKSRVEYIYSMGAKRPHGTNDDWYEATKKVKLGNGVTVTAVKTLNKDGSLRGISVSKIDGARVNVGSATMSVSDAVKAVEEDVKKFNGQLDAMYEPDFLETKLQQINEEKGMKFKRHKGEDALFDDAVKFLTGFSYLNPVEKAKVLAQLKREGLNDAYIFQSDVIIPTNVSPQSPSPTPTLVESERGALEKGETQAATPKVNKKDADPSTKYEQASNDYYIKDQDTNKFIKVKDAKKVKLSVDGDFFYVKEGSWYRVYEGSSGQALASDAKTLKEAVDKANENIEKNSKTLPVDKAVEYEIKKDGLSPRYKKSDSQISPSKASPEKKAQFREAILSALESANGSEFSEVTSDIALQDSDRKTAVKNIRKGKSTVATKKVEEAIETMWADGYVYLNRGRGDHSESFQMPIAEFLNRLTQNDEAFQDLSRQAQNLQASLDALGEDLFSDTVEEVVSEVVEEAVERGELPTPAAPVEENRRFAFTSFLKMDEPYTKEEVLQHLTDTVPAGPKAVHYGFGKLESEDLFEWVKKKPSKNIKPQHLFDEVTTVAKREADGKIALYEIDKNTNEMAEKPFHVFKSVDEAATVIADVKERSRRLNIEVSASPNLSAKVGFDKWIKDGLMTAAQAKAIIESAAGSVPEKTNNISPQTQSNELKTPSTPSQDTNTPQTPTKGSNEANRTTGSPAPPAQSKSGKYESKARKLADKIKKADLPSWMSIQDPSVKKQGLSADDLKAALAEAVIKVGQLLDMGVDAKVAVNRGVDDIVRLYREELAKVKGKLKLEAEAAIRRGAEDEIRKDLGLPPAGSVVLSHKGLQEVADEFGLDDVQRRERKSDAELLQEAEETMQDWKDRGVYAREVEHLVSLAESARVLTDTERVILEQHLANLIGEARGLRASDPSAYDEALVEIRRVKRAGEITRSAAGAALRIPSNAGSVPRTIEDAMVDRMEAAGVDVLTEEQKRDVEARFAAMQAALAEEKRLREAAEAANVRLQAEAEILAARKTRPAPQPKAAKQKDYKKEREGIKAAIKEKLRKSRGQMNSAGQAMIDFVSIAPDVARLMKSYVEEGVVTLAEIIQKIHADVKEVEPSITEDDIRDIIAGKYNEPRPTKSDLLRQMQDLRTEAKLLAKLADLESGEIPASPRKQVVRNQRIKELRDQIEALQKSSGLGRYSPSAKERAAIEAAKESIQEMERKIRENDLSIQQHKGPDTPALRALRDKQKDLRKQIDAKRKEAGLGKWAGDYQLRKIKERNEAKLREVQAKLKAGDFSTKPRPKPAIENPEFKAKYPELYQQTLDAIAAKEKAQHELNLANAREAMALRPGIEKVMGKFGKALRTLKATMAGIDMSALGVQNLPAILSNPYVGFKAFKGSLTDMGSAAHFERELARIHASEWWPLIEQSGLSIIDPKSLRQAEHNDLFNNTFYDDLNITRNGRKVNIAPTKPFERQFTSLGNYIRINLFLRRAEKLLEQGKTFENSPESFKTIASIVNNMTGRGSGGEWFEKNRQALSTIFWSPGLMSSSFNLLGISDVALLFVGKKGFYGKILTSDQKLWAAGQIGRAISTGIVIMLAIAWSDDEAEIDWDPTSVTFGYVKSGDYSWSIFGRFTKPVRYIVMRLTGIKNTPAGEVELDDNPYGATMGEELYRGVSGYFNPVFGTGVNIAKGTDFSGQPTNVANEVGKMLYPMSFGEFYKGYQADGVGGVLKKGVPSFAGIRVTHRKDFYRPLEAPKKLRHNGVDVDLPEGLQQQFTKELQASEAAKLPVLQATDAYRAATPQQRLEMEAWLRKTVKAEEQKRLKESHPDLFPELSEEEELEKEALEEQRADLKYLLFGEEE